MTDVNQLILRDLGFNAAIIQQKMSAMYNEHGEFIGSEEYYDYLFAELCQVRKDIERYSK